MSEEAAEPLRLDQLGADALQCVLMANDTFERDVLFAALTSTTLLEAMRRALREREKQRRRAWHLVERRRWVGTLVTSVDGVYCSASRIEFCKLHLSAATLPAANALGHLGSCEMRFPGIALTTVPTEALHAFVKSAPTDLILRYFRPRDCGNFGSSREWLGMLMFSAMYGRVDVLEGLTDYDDELHRCTPWMDTLFKRPAIDRLLACPNAAVQSSHRQREFDQLVTVLIRPALLERQSAVLGWVQKVSFKCAQNFARRDPDMRFPISEDRIEFAGMYVTRETMFANKGEEGGGLHQLRLAILDALIGDFEVPFVRSIGQIVERWTRPIEEDEEANWGIDLRWMGELALLLVTRAIMSRNGRGRLMKTLVELCRTHRVALCEMWQLGYDEEPEFNLHTIARAVGNMPAQHFEDVTVNALWHMTLLPGDAAYNEWVLSELFERDASTSWLARPWGFSSADAVELHVDTVCGRFLDDQTYELLYAHREMRAPALVGSTSTYHFVDPAAIVYTTRMMRWKWSLEVDPEPCELQRAIAFAASRSMEYTLACENPHVGARSNHMSKHLELDAAMQLATIALLPHMQRLYERFASNKVCRASLCKLVLDLAAWWMGTKYACGYRKGGVVSHLVMAYKHGIFSRERFDQRLERIELTGWDVDTHKNMHNGDRVAQVAALEDLRRRFATIDAELGRARA